MFAWELSNHLEANCEVVKIVNRGGKKTLPAFIPRAFMTGLRAIWQHQPDVIHLADGLMAPVGALLKATTGTPVTASIHGLDVTYPNRLYRRAVIPALKRLDLSITNSAATAAMLERDGVRRWVTIPLGINSLPASDGRTRAEFAAYAGVDLVAEKRKILLTVGRLVKRKGVAWFVENVLPGLSVDFVYVVIGEGPEHDAITAAADRVGLSEKVRLLGRVETHMLSAAYATSDIFVMPNIPVSGDMEGFGLVALEAASSALPVVASDLEGITEAVIDSQNGFLAPAGDRAAYIAVVEKLLKLPAVELKRIGQRFAASTRETFSWEETARRYRDAFAEMSRKSESRANRILSPDSHNRRQANGFWRDIGGQ